MTKKLKEFQFNWILLDKNVNSRLWEKNKIVFTTSQLYSNFKIKAIEFSRRFNDSDEFEDAYDEIDDEDEDELDDEEDDNTSRRSKMTKTLSGQALSSTIHSAAAEFNTPLGSDKRSRSLISLRRRHWSASSNRSSTTVVQQQPTQPTHVSQQPPQVNKNFVNIQDRSRRKLFNSQQNHLLQTNVVAATAAKPNLNSTEIYPSVNRAAQRKQQPQPHLMNATSAMNLSSVSKMSKNLRKSFNDLCSATASRLNATLTAPRPPPPIYTASELRCQENLKKFEKICMKQKPSSPAHATLTQKYTKRLKGFKQRLIKTKNSLFGGGQQRGKRKCEATANNGSDQENQQTTADSNASHAHNNNNNNESQSAVPLTVKLKFMKRNRSDKSAASGSDNLNASISTKLSNTYLGRPASAVYKTSNYNQPPPMQHLIYESSPNKRPKFY
jgi:hypothetical protein